MLKTGLAGLIVVLSFVASACTVTTEPPDIDDAHRVALQAQAFAEACREVLCNESPMLASDSMPESLREAILEAFTDEVIYVADDSLQDWVNDDGIYRDGAVLLIPETPFLVEGAIVGVDVQIYRAPHNVAIRTYLFRWNGERWVSVDAGSVGITLTTAVS